MKRRIGLLAALILLFTLSTSAVFAIPSDGEYDVEVRLLQAYKDDLSMGNKALNQRAKLIVEKGSARLQIVLEALDFMDFTGYLGTLTIAGRQVNVIERYDVYDEYNDPASGIDALMKGIAYPRVLEFPIDLNEKYIDCVVYVPIMAEMAAGEQKARIEVIYPEGLKTERVEPRQSETAVSTTAPAQTTAVETATESEAADATVAYYNVPVALWHVYEDKPSMGDAAMKNMANLVVEGTDMSLYVGADKMDVMNLTTSLVGVYYDDGEKFIKAKDYAYDLKIEGQDGVRPMVFMIPLASKAQYLNVLVDPKVEPMGDDPIGARIKIDFNRAEQIDRAEAELFTLAESGRAKPLFDPESPVTRTDKGIVLKAESGTFTEDFNFYANAIRGEALTKLKKDYQSLPQLASISAYKVAALGDLQEIPHQVEGSLNDLRRVYSPKGAFSLGLPLSSSDAGKTISLYALDSSAEPVEYSIVDDMIWFSYDKFVPFAVVAEKGVNNELTGTALSRKDDAASVKSRNVQSAAAAQAQIQINSAQKAVERPALIMLSLLTILVVLGAAVYFSRKYLKIVFAELDYANDIRREKIKREQEGKDD